MNTNINMNNLIKEKKKPETCRLDCPVEYNPNSRCETCEDYYNVTPAVEMEYLGLSG